jgi:broad specificity phosphatase PhoE
MTRLVLVRHAMPLLDPTQPARLWRLGDEGRAAARQLRPLIDGSAPLLSSDEPKAVQTLREATGRDDVLTDAGFREVTRPDVRTGDYRERARAYLRGDAEDGWEPPAQVADRFAQAIARVVGGPPPVIGTHGLALTLWLTGVVGGDPVRRWEGLRFPDLLEVDLAAGTVTRLTEV